MFKITSISFPNNATEEHQTSYTVGRGCDEIQKFVKNGEMAVVGWISIIKGNKAIAEIKESVCNIYGEEDLTKQ